MNLVIQIGRLTGVPELRYTNTQKPVARFNIAVDREGTGDNQPKVDYFSVIVWNNLAESCSTYLVKGQKVCVRGRIQNRKYQVNGEDKQITEIIAERVEFLEKPRGSETTPEKPKQTGKGSGAATPDQWPYGNTMEDNDDLPF